MNVIIKYLLSTIFFIIIWWAKAIVIFIIGYLIVGERIMERPPAIFGLICLAAIYTSYLVIKKINEKPFFQQLYNKKKEIKSDEKLIKAVKAIKKGKIWWKSKWLKILALLITLVGLGFAVNLLLEIKDKQRNILEYKGWYKYNSANDDLSYIHGLYNFLSKNDIYIKSYTEFRQIFKSQDRRKLLYDDLVHISYFTDIITDYETFLLEFCNPDENYLELNTNDIKEIKNSKAFDTNNNLMGSFSKEGKREGEWKMYYANNILAVEGFYENGLMNGYFKHYRENGILRHEGTYVNGSRDEINFTSGIPNSGRIGMHKFYDSDGELKENAFYKDKERLTTREAWYKNGVKKSYTEYGYYGTPKGFYKYWDENGECTSEGSN